ncbi:glial cell line-derived neurotrophic factor-like [Brachionichthys hirsutus]|uniref:glial cell line-derived neurotrophic factor-like n=1 Tax=Brachionichthys hirsutus TaxID=412623 RepID=UPI003604E0F6
MKLWDSLTTCLMLLSAAFGSSLLRSRQQRGRAGESPLERPPLQVRLAASSSSDAQGWEEALLGGEYATEDLPSSELEDLVDFIKVTVSRMQRSSSSAVSTSTSSSVSKENLSRGTRQRRQRRKQVIQRQGGKGGARWGRTGRKVQERGGGRRGQGCALKQIHLNVSDLGLGYRSSEEMLFKYCSGPCRKSETNYDKILYNLAHSRRLSPKDRPAQACCRPIAFDDDLSFLDNSLVYHTVRRHSARKCACV